MQEPFALPLLLSVGNARSVHQSVSTKPIVGLHALVRTFESYVPFEPSPCLKREPLRSSLQSGAQGVRIKRPLRVAYSVGQEPRNGEIRPAGINGRDYDQAG